MATGILTANALDPRLTLQSHSATLGLTCNLVPQPPCAPPPQVDGGVSAANIAEIAEAGADMFVAGSAIFNSAPSSPRSLPRPPRDAPRPPRAPSTSPHPSARARSRLPASGCCGFGFPVAHSCAPPCPQPRTTRPPSTACARSSPRSPSRARPRSRPRSPPRSPPEREATPSRVSARRASQRATRTSSNLETRVVAVAKARASSLRDHQLGDSVS